MLSDSKELQAKHPELTQSDDQKVASHKQRKKDGWYFNTVMLEGYDVAFKFKRQRPYQSLKGARINLSYYPEKEIVAGMEFEIMKVVRIKRS